MSSSVARISRVSAMLSQLSAIQPHLHTVLRMLPTLAKYLLCLLFLVNVRSWPLAWHIRVFRPVFRIRFAHKWVQLRNMFRPRAARIKAEDEWLDSITPVGADPFDSTIRYRTWASIDESDFNGHLSNSSYAKTLDAARFKAALSLFPMLFRAGGWIALAGTHYSFIREIPMLAPYEVRLSIGSWDQKWIYVVGKFVSKPKKKGKKSTREVSSSPQSQQQPTPLSKVPDTSAANGTADTGTLFAASLRMPNDGEEISVSPTPLHMAGMPPNGSATPSSHSAVAAEQENGAAGPDADTDTDTAKALKAVAASLAATPEPDGAVLHTVNVSQCCFKIGRITIPPAVVLAVNGFHVPPAASSSSPSSAEPYSHAHPPPHWSTVKSLMARPAGGSPRVLREFLKGGWRDVPEGERWWEDALGGAVEERRRQSADVFKALTAGLTGVREL